MELNKYYRYELKYLINYFDYIILKNRISNIMHLDKNADENGKYHIRSIYFDDFLNTSYYDKINGVQNRYKYRIRFYNLNDSLIKLEKKIKKGNFSTKIDYTLNKEKMYNILLNRKFKLENTKNSFLNEFLYLMNYKGLKPVIMLDYNREAYVYPLGKVRITFDMDLVAITDLKGIFERNINSINILDKGKIILEIKYEKYIPTVIKNLVQIGSRNALAISKYVLCRSMFM